MNVLHQRSPELQPLLVALGALPNTTKIVITIEAGEVVIITKEEYMSGTLPLVELNKLLKSYVLVEKIYETDKST